jgi:hypothetical protein
MDATGFFRMLVPTYRIIWCHVPGDHQNIDHPHLIGNGIQINIWHIYFSEMY